MAAAERTMMFARLTPDSTIIRSRRASSDLTRSSAAMRSSSVWALRALIFSLEIAFVILLMVLNAPVMRTGGPSKKLEHYFVTAALMASALAKRSLTLASRTSA
jgi:hypothetical protein